jgi:tRNA (cmo5U34)-methyltransferase
MSDNASAHPASAYEDEVRRTIPFHAAFLELAVEAALAAVPAPARWLDTGCGPGRLVELARARCPEASFFLADPSIAMLDLARARHPDLPADRFVLAPSHALPELGAFDVITAVQCHHYYPEAGGREGALRRCRAMLRPGGALVVFENVRAETDAGHALQRQRWAAWQRAQGRDEATVTAQLAREGTKFFPIRGSEHARLLERIGFATVEPVWRAYGQAGFLAIAPG